MQGKVKWFSVEKGFGFIVGDDGTERHFDVRDIKGVDLPANGDVVSFDPAQGKKGPRASSVTLLSRAPSKFPSRSDDRVECTLCGRKMVPRIITYQGRLMQSVCPFCGGRYEYFSPCFIATAVYGDRMAPQVVAFRQYRDSTLRHSAVGRLFIATYYRWSPPIARILSRSPQMARLVRVALDALLRLIG
jgi:cold shock CspA family protein